LDSANGVFVGARRVATEPVRLETGARVLVAGIELEVSYEREPEPSGQTPRLRVGFGAREPDEVAPSSTRTTEFLELMSKIVERMLAEGRTDEALSILQARLDLVLEEARAGNVQSFDQVRTALRHGLLLAERTQSPRWIGYVLELLTLFHELPDELEAQRLEAAIKHSQGMDAHAADAYAESLKQIADPLRRMRGMQYARAFQRAVLAARR
jgi:hypothetical protein